MPIRPFQELFWFKVTSKPTLPRNGRVMCPLCVSSVFWYMAPIQIAPVFEVRPSFGVTTNALAVDWKSPLRLVLV